LLVETMMNSPNCPEHSRLVLDLALGRLDDDAAAQAEAISESCPVCRAWWQAQFTGEEMAIVDEAVASVFDGLDLPERRRGHGWMALAAAMVMALGATALWLAQSPMSPGADQASPVVVERMAAIQSMDFESPAAVVAQTEPTSGPAAVVAIEEPGFAPVEGEVLVTDEIVVAKATPDDAPLAADSEPLFAGRFESGDLSDWVPST
jgi:hypothetical protein